MKVLLHVDNAWQGILDYYNSEKVGSYFLRREFKEKGFNVKKKSGGREELQMAVIDQYGLILRRAGYLQKVDNGVYKKVKAIPKNLTTTQALREAYGDRRKVKAPKVEKQSKKPLPDFMRPMQLNNQQLREIVGFEQAPRTEIVKKVWGYIKANGLQDLKNRRNINLDDKLALAFGYRDLSKPISVSMFEMTKIISKQTSEVKREKASK